MTEKLFDTIKTYMCSCMKDSAHDIAHVNRVLNMAMYISKNYENVNQDVVIAAALLHDIGRDAEFRNPMVCHAVVGGEMAKSFLYSETHDHEFALHVGSCIATHRYRINCKPSTLEAKIIFDSDKLDVTGAMGIARTLLYEGKMNIPLYVCDEQDDKIDFTRESFLNEYNYKLRKIYDSFYTPEAKMIARNREKISSDFYNALLKEIEFGGYIC